MCGWSGLWQEAFLSQLAEALQVPAEAVAVVREQLKSARAAESHLRIARHLSSQVRTFPCCQCPSHSLSASHHPIKQALLCLSPMNRFPLEAPAQDDVHSFMTAQHPNSLGSRERKTPLERQGHGSMPLL